VKICNSAYKNGQKYEFISCLSNIENMFSQEGYQINVRTPKKKRKQVLFGKLLKPHTEININVKLRMGMIF